MRDQRLRGFRGHDNVCGLEKFTGMEPGVTGGQRAVGKQDRKERAGHD